MSARMGNKLNKLIKKTNSGKFKYLNKLQNEICKDFKQLSQSIKANLWSCGFSKKSYKELSLEISKDFDSLSLNLGIVKIVRTSIHIMVRSYLPYIYLKVKNHTFLGTHQQKLTVLLSLFCVKLCGVMNLFYVKNYEVLMNILNYQIDLNF